MVFFIVLFFLYVVESKYYVEITQTGIDEKPVLFKKWELKECYRLSVDKSQSYMYKNKDDVLSEYYYSDSECKNDETLARQITVGENSKTTYEVPEHIAFTSSADDIDCPNRDTLDRNYYTSNVVESGSQFSKYEVREYEGADYLYSLQCEDQNCKSEVSATRIFKCDTCEGVLLNYQMQQCGSPSLVVVISALLLYLLI
ncbi:hypothetical protein EIN_408940 [Entamoeba invadens IP1]|uniref:Uncharacterized protein n=1 Tax=Entamoeba invadens IP1 TaxID=370355 RepID=A0A0A1TZK9_ENTIV|nr:hypothetical protein EIN_408940 [Entamoeba invadens IP1]ELP85615.1 hypothetical protein EIN_408940 [Entamoeba invadens IP1]|eukprot:XP_004184961.1 hypothetical protein EIN_408940 [Entamoeba invadens IP1]